VQKRLLGGFKMSKNVTITYIDSICGSITPKSITITPYCLISLESILVCQLCRVCPKTLQN